MFLRYLALGVSSYRGSSSRAHVLEVLFLEVLVVGILALGLMETQLVIAKVQVSLVWIHHSIGISDAKF